MKTIQERIKSLRMEGETQVQFAERLGTTQASISRYINGRQPDRETLLKIAERTGTSLDWLLTGRGSGSSGEDGGHSDPLTEAMRSFARLDGLTSEDKEVLQDMVSQYVKDPAIRQDILSFWRARGGRAPE
ncbi:MAG: helix-turn-helix transcriptional regulator [bacterium]